MANTVNIVKLMDGPRQAIFHVYIESDGSSGEITDLVLIDPTQLSPTTKGVPSLTIEEIWHSFAGFNAKLEYDSLVDTPVWVLTENNDHKTCLKEFGGLKDRSNLLDGTGKLLLTTVGFSSAGDMGSLVIQVRKD